MSIYVYKVENEAFAVVLFNTTFLIRHQKIITLRMFHYCSRLSYIFLLNYMLSRQNVLPRFELLARVEDSDMKMIFQINGKGETPLA